MKVKENIFGYPDNPFKSDYKIIAGDTLTSLKKIETGKFDLIITSPPYNVGEK
jgi:adenine-specific DNA-methyltransferase